MAIVTVGHRPDLTPDKALEAFQQEFAGKYEVYKTRIRNRDFIVKKSAWAGVSVRVKQDSDETSFVFTGMMPNLLLQSFIGAIGYLVLRPSMQAMEREVGDFIQREFAAASS